MIEILDLEYIYPESDSDFALRGLSFQLHSGESVALMGSNGSGKTTLARCLNGLLLPASGSVVVDKMSTADEDQLHEIRRHVGMVFQNPDMQIVTTTVEREVAFGLENLGLDHAEMVQRVDEALARFHLSSYRQIPPHRLSGGERQRLALASVWVMQPSYYVMDEPTSLLDPKTREEIRNFIRVETKANRGMLLITQFPEEALWCERLLVLHDGKLVFDNPPETVFQNQDVLKEMGLDVPIHTELQAYVRRLGFEDRI
ncbi:ATP-binding cassette domain-containing protein [candidate division KSB1 bacterium]|nr:ATP-binding cassette domain-containing protein [candidate division KSB1 bacterium]